MQRCVATGVATGGAADGSTTIELVARLVAVWAAANRAVPQKEAWKALRKATMTRAKKTNTHHPMNTESSMVSVLVHSGTVGRVGATVGDLLGVVQGFYRPKESWCVRA